MSAEVSADTCGRTVHGHFKIAEEWLIRSHGGIAITIAEQAIGDGSRPPERSAGFGTPHDVELRPGHTTAAMTEGYVRIAMCAEIGPA